MTSSAEGGAAPLLQELAGGVLTLTLNRPDSRNALSAELIEALHEALDHAELDARVRVVALRGAGQDFCAGADHDELLVSTELTLADNERSALRLGLLFQRFRELPKPVVAVVHGRALAGGAGLATACDISLAADSAEIGYPEIGYGLVPAMAMTLLRRLAGEKLALDLLLTGRLLRAPEAAAAGLLTRTVSEPALDAEAVTLLTTLATVSGSGLALTKQLFYQLDGLPFTESIGLGARTDALARSTPDLKEALRRFVRR
jgi:methylglutaconyl-CoA hydratase